MSEARLVQFFTDEYNKVCASVDTALVTRDRLICRMVHALNPDEVTEVITSYQSAEQWKDKYYRLVKEQER